MDENELAMSCGVETFLQAIGLQAYSSTFVIRGYDREADLLHLGEEDLDKMLISEPSHRRVLLTAVRKHALSDEGILLEWLRENNLEHYFIGFVRSQLVDIDEVGRLELPDDNIYDELEISMPGHRRRLERAVRRLRKQQKVGESAEIPLAEGYWGKPHNLDDAKYDFLCVEAVIASTTDTSRKHKIDFMVDSGSDVTTLQEELLYTLNPELIGPINSKGVHSSMRKNLYRAKLSIGSQDLEIEVMGESYNSLGSRVLRHFRHYITGSKHIWLSGDYFDPMMSSSLMTAAKLTHPGASDGSEHVTMTTPVATTTTAVTMPTSAVAMPTSAVALATSAVAMATPAVAMTTPAVVMTTPAVAMTIPAVTIATSAVAMNTPAVDMNTPAETMNTPAVTMNTPAEKSAASTLNCTSANLSDMSQNDVKNANGYESFSESIPVISAHGGAAHIANNNDSIIPSSDGQSGDNICGFVNETDHCNTEEYSISTCEPYTDDSVDGKLTVKNVAAHFQVEAMDGDCS